MEVIHYIAPRQTGKTLKAVNLFWEHNTPNTYIVVGNQHQKRQLQQRRIPEKQILSVRPNSLRGKMIQTLIVDDYLINIKDKDCFINEVVSAISSNDAQLFLLSTPDKKYTNDYLIEHPYLFLRSETNLFNVTVISTIRDPAYYGFRRWTPVEQERARHFFATQESFECEILGQYSSDWSVNDYYIPRPKQFILKNVV